MPWKLFPTTTGHWLDEHDDQASIHIFDPPSTATQPTPDTLPLLEIWNCLISFEVSFRKNFWVCIAPTTFYVCFYFRIAGTSSIPIILFSFLTRKTTSTTTASAEHGWAQASRLTRTECSNSCYTNMKIRQTFTISTLPLQALTRYPVISKLGRLLSPHGYSFMQSLHAPSYHIFPNSLMQNVLSARDLESVLLP
jgi:hypothetical protein